MKDYYAILELPVTATPAEMKKAYRKLVMIYHPDKHNNDPYTLTRFNEIKEAYEVLTNPSAKEQYLQERWLKKAGGCWMPDEPLTPPVILKQVLELNRSVAKMDVHRMDYDRVEKQINHLLREEVLQKLLFFQDAEVNRFIVHTFLQCTNALPLPHTQRIAKQLQQLAANDPQLLQSISTHLLQKQKAAKTERRMPWLIILLVILVCLLIYSAGK